MIVSSSTTGGRSLGRREGVALLAMLMALNAFAIDAMIPALPAIGRELGVASENHRQLVVIAYFFGFGSTQLIWGPLADRFGRRPVLAGGIALYASFGLLCAFATSFSLLIAARFAMGASAAVTRVLVTAMVRDLYDGEAMAKVMSLVFMVFIVVPVVAPSIGSLILLVGTWRTIFLLLAGYAAVMMAWSMTRLPETLHPDYRRSLDPRVIAGAVREALRDRLSIGYTLATTAIMGGLTAYIASIQQIAADYFHAGSYLPLIFAAVAAPMSAASFANSQLVGRFGLRRVAHCGVVAMVAVTWLHAALALSLAEPLWLFIALQAVTMVTLAFCSSNFSTLAMTNMAAIAGTASSVQGVIGTLLGTAIGLVIGQQFDGTPRPFLLGLALCAATGLALVAWTERGRMFTRRVPVPASA